MIKPTFSTRGFFCLFLSILAFGAGAIPSAWAKFRLESPKGQNTIEPAEANLKIGQQAIKTGDLDSAIDAFLQAIYFSRNNYNPQAYYLLGECYKQKKLDAKAIEAFKKSIEQSMGPCADAHIELGEVLMRVNRLNEAEAEISKGVTDNDGPLPKAYLLFGQLMEKQGFIDGAEADYLNALGDPPWTYVDAWMALTMCYMQQKQWSAAATQFVKMLQREGDLRPKGLNLEEVLLNLGVAYAAKGDHQDAIDSWHKVLAVNPDSAKAHLNLAKLFDSENHISSAVDEYRAYIRSAAPEDSDLAKTKDRLLALEQQLRQPAAPSSEQPYKIRSVEPAAPVTDLPAGSGF